MVPTPERVVLASASAARAALLRAAGIEFAIDIAPSDRQPALVTARARKAEPIEYGDVTVRVAWAS